MTATPKLPITQNRYGALCLPADADEKAMLIRRVGWKQFPFKDDRKSASVCISSRSRLEPIAFTRPELFLKSIDLGLEAVVFGALPSQERARQARALAKACRSEDIDIAKLVRRPLKIA